MLIAEEIYPSIEIHQLVRNVIDFTETGRSRLLGNYIIIDVNDKDKYDKVHIIGAIHYNRLLLCRLNYETEILKEARINEKTVVIYGSGAPNVTATLFQRGYKTVLLKGDIPLFLKFYPIGLLSQNDEQLNISELKKTYQHLKDTRWGKGRIMHIDRSYRSKSIDKVRERQRPRSVKRAWR